VRRMGADYLLYLIMDSAVDGYFYLLERIEEHIQRLEDEIAANPTSKTPRSIHTLKRSVIRLQKNLWPLREVVGKLEEARYEFITDKIGPFSGIFTTMWWRRSRISICYIIMISDMIDVYFSAVSTKLNEIMKNADHDRNNIHALDIHSRSIWDEFQIHAGA
ncbi:MAG: CorA family divalent cation transporter, partial [Thermofilum sp.]